MKSLGYLIGGLLGLIGIISLYAASQGNLVPRVIAGVIFIAAGLFVARVMRLKVPDQRIIQQVDLAGDVHPEQMTCKSCGAPLDQKSVSVRAGGIFVDCPYCGTSYQIEEEPKW